MTEPLRPPKESASPGSIRWFAARNAAWGSLLGLVISIRHWFLVDVGRRLGRLADRAAGKVSATYACFMTIHDSYRSVLRAVTGHRESGQIRARVRVRAEGVREALWEIQAVPAREEWVGRLHDSEEYVRFDRRIGGEIRTAGGNIEILTPNYQGVPFALWPCFPEKMPVWGRHTDMWEPSDIRADDNTVTLGLRPTKRGAGEGVLVIDSSINLITQITLPRQWLTVETVAPQGPITS